MDAANNIWTMDAAEGEVLVRGQTGVSGSIHKDL